MKDVEVRLVAELLKNSNRSDRELSKALGVAQPTVSRTRSRLEKSGVIREYTVIPDFSKLGFSLLALTFVTLRTDLPPEKKEEARRAAKEGAREELSGIIMMERGEGLGYDGVIVSLHQSYSDFSAHRKEIRNFPFIDASKIETFIIDLQDKVRYRPLSFRHLIKQMMTQVWKQEKKDRRLLDRFKTEPSS